jgi:hypothetical protein
MAGLELEMALTAWVSRTLDGDYASRRDEPPSRCMLRPLVNVERSRMTKTLSISTLALMAAVE